MMLGHPPLLDLLVLFQRERKRRPSGQSPILVTRIAPNHEELVEKLPRREISRAPNVSENPIRNLLVGFENSLRCVNCVWHCHLLDLKRSAAVLETPMTNPVTAFKIPVADLDRAIKFYTAVFGHKFEREVVDGNEMAWFPFDPKAPGASGSLAKGGSYVPGKSGARLYFHTVDIDGTLARAVAAGGQVLYAKRRWVNWGGWPSSRTVKGTASRCIRRKSEARPRRVTETPSAWSPEIRNTGTARGGG